MAALKAPTALAQPIGSMSFANEGATSRAAQKIFGIKPPAETEETPMPRSGAVTLRDLTAQDGNSHIIIVCQPCGREGRYSVHRLLETLGDMGLPDLLAQLTQDCAKHQNVAIHDRCRAVFRW